MRAFMENKMNLIFQDFKESLEVEEKYCKLKKFRFDSSNIPDYNMNLIQQYYLLKYLPAYLVEYYCIYLTIVQKKFICEDYNILSIGCGCGIDLWGCHFAMRDSAENYKIGYTGLDIVDWKYWDECGDEVYFLKENIDRRTSLDENNYNVIMFPKSIGEFSTKDFEKLKMSIINTKFTSNKIILVASVRSTRTNIDIDRLVELAKILKDSNGYSILDNCNSYTYYKKKDNGYPYRINDIINNYLYPEHMKEYLINFYKNCQGYIDNNKNCCEDTCEDIFTRLPITTLSQVAFNIIRLEK